VSDVYEFIDVEYATCETAPAITRMCAWLEVSKSGYYEWLSRPESATAQRREELKLRIGDIFDDSDGTYGYRRIAAQLARRGVAAGEELVRRLMRELGLVACQPRPWRPATTVQGASGPIPDLVNRDFTAEVPGAKMVADITYIPTWEGWLFLATVIDCATRKVAGWAMDDNYRTPLISSAIAMAARNIALPPGAVFHSDRGSNYQCHLVKNWMQNGQDGLVAASDVARLFHREGAAFVFLDDAGVRPFAAAFTDSFEDFPDRHDPRVLEPAGGKMPPGL
jgi:transposase InsO family protein